MRLVSARTRTLVSGVLGLTAVAVAVAVVVAPDAVMRSPVSSLVEAAAEADSEQVLLAVAAVVGLLALWAARSRTRADPDDAFATLTETPPETVAIEDDVVAGRRFDDQFADAIATRGWYEGEVVSILRATAVDVVALTDAADAEEAVDDGTWTDDPLAAATLAGPDGPRPSFWARLRKWLDPAAERERRIRRTVAAIEAALPDESTAGGRR
jgi:hypothetical protein